MLKRIIAFALVIVLLCPVLSSCNTQKRTKTETFFAMDTVVEVKLPATTENAQKLFEGCREIAERYEGLFDSHDPQSEIGSLNDSQLGLAVSAEVVELVELALSISTATSGAFDITVKPVLELWEIAEREGVLPSDERLASALAFVDSGSIICDADTKSINKREGQRLDLGGVAKGAAAQQMVSYLSSNGAQWGIISVGGNIAAFGERGDDGDFKIGIRDPFDGRGVLGTVKLRDGFVSVSGDYERYYEIDGARYHHIIDPKTGYPSNSGLHSVVVVSDDGALSDALSTALFVLGEEASRELYQSGVFAFEAIFVSDGKISVTDGLRSKFELDNEEYQLIK